MTRHATAVPSHCPKLAEWPYWFLAGNIPGLTFLAMLGIQPVQIRRFVFAFRPERKLTMAVAIFVSWPGITTDRYDAVRKIVDWEGDAPAGGLLHIAAIDGNGLQIVDLWETQEAFQDFLEKRLSPGIAQASVVVEPTVQVRPVHAIFAPGFESPRT